MARGKRTDSETRAKIISMKVENPDLSAREIGEKVGLNNNTTTAILNEDLPEVLTSSHKTIELVNVNLDIIKNGKEVIKQSIGKLPVERYGDLSQLSKVLEDAFKQNQLLTGQATDNINISDMSEEQKKIIAERWINKN